MAEQLRLAVVDASVVLKWQLADEEDAVPAITLRDDYFLHNVVSLIAPQFMVYEVANGIASASRRRRITPEKAADAMVNLMAINVQLRPVDPVMALELALRYGLAAYDSAYLALAREEGCDIWTGDRAFYVAAGAQHSCLRWIGDYGKD